MRATAAKIDKMAASLAHKKIIETALVDYLGGLFNGVQIASTYSAEDVKLPCIVVQFDAGAAENKTTMTVATDWHEDYIFGGSVVLQYISRRGESPAPHFDFVAKLRAAMLAGFVMDSDNLNLSPLALAQIDFGGEAYSYDESFKGDMTELAYALKYVLDPAVFDALA